MDKNPQLVLLGNRIKEIRKAQGISQDRLAYKAGIDRSYMGSIERGERNVSVLTLVKLAVALECKVADMTNVLPHDTK